jgi:hypothetical protein
VTQSPTPEVPQDVLAHAHGEAWAAVCDTRAVEMLRRYYDPARNYAGSTFVGLEPNDPRDITATDLYALSLLDVNAGPLAGRLLLEAGAYRDRVLAALADPHLGHEVALETAEACTFAAAEELYLAFRDALGKRPWVTASKLCARKRPLLLPVRDSVVTTNRLRLGKDYLVDWQVYKTLLQDTGLVTQLRELVDEAQSGTTFQITDPVLRILDVLLWMTADASMRPRSGSGAR